MACLHPDSLMHPQLTEMLLPTLQDLNKHLEDECDDNKGDSQTAGDVEFQLLQRIQCECSRLAWATKQFQRQPEQLIKTLPQN